MQDQRKPKVAKTWLSTAEIAARYGVDSTTVSRWCQSGRLSARKVGRHWRIRVRDWKAFRDAGMPAKAEPVAAKPAPAKKRKTQAERDLEARGEAVRARLAAMGV